MSRFEPQTSCVKRVRIVYCATTLLFILEHGLPFHNLISEKYFCTQKEPLCKCVFESVVSLESPSISTQHDRYKPSMSCNRIIIFLKIARIVNANRSEMEKWYLRSSTPIVHLVYYLQIILQCMQYLLHISVT